MFFTIVIPAYNCEKTIDRLLASIENQYCPEELKVIITDDSDKDHDDLYAYVKPYQKKFLIDYYKREKTPYTIHCPGNTRHSGLKKALKENTEYILFIDCDDEFIPNTFKTMKELIVQSRYPDIIGSRFDAYNENGTFAYKEQNSLGWLHGKLFKKTFLEKYNIQFKVDMEAHEDTYFNCLLTYYQIRERIESAYFDNICFYKWYRRAESTSHKENIQDRNDIFIQKHFRDYLYSCIGVFLDNFKRDEKFLSPQLKQDFMVRTVHSIYMAYCYFQGFMNSGRLDRIKDCYEALKECIWEYYKTFNVGQEDLIKVVYSMPQIFINHRNISYVGVGHFIERESFQDFIHNMRFYE